MTVENFAMVRAGKNIGSIEVVDSGDRLDITSRVSELEDSGWGEGLVECVGLGVGGVPVWWRVSGVSLAGAVVSE
uniref:hypothetical protein n=1 Tax=Amycolatopsis jejuensis TaxID=330084 RepID=UPI00052608AB